MKQNVLLLAATASVASGRPQYGTPTNPHEWIPVRGPCPMLNTLTNHGFLPRDGRNFTKENVIKGLGDGLNFDHQLAGLMWEQAIIANPEPNATFFTLEQLNVHNVLEHDASLSRTDAAFGNNHVFNQTVFDTSKMWWTGETVTAEQLAHSKIYRQLVSRSENDNYTFSASTEEFSLGEVAAPIIAFGDTNVGTVPRDLMVYFFENERLPEELGWSKKNASITLQTILSTTAIVRNATNLLTGGVTTPADPHKRRELHGGLF
ncbi:heme-thiolate peroxidase [Boeremia exigua]|uniref:Heme-thiolate peroxidase n=1 Tax=Boeremia exigua TaxID=749465 RepID=A0ACC2IQA2_9PLEO|nr:heme-thiolate peroxidase [Boeremia exigua]